MSVINPNETARNWRTQKSESGVQLYLSGADGDAAALVGARVAGLPLSLSVAPVTDWIDPEELEDAAVAVIQVDADTPASVKRFEKLANSGKAPLIAAVYDPPLKLVRSLIRAGAHDVIPLPLDVADLEISLAAIHEEIRKRQAPSKAATGKLVTCIKSVGGAGATSLLGQVAIRFAEHERAHGREACLLDLDVQFGNAAFQLGLRPNLTLSDILEAGARLDGDLLRSVTATHPSGLNLLGAPAEMMPLESLSSDQVLHLIEVAGREFGTVFVDLPANWTNWSLSLLARSDLVLLVTELTIPSIERARRQLDLMRAQELEDLNVRIVVNRFEKGVLRTIRPGDVRQALGRDIAYTVTYEPLIMRAALDQGVPISEVKRKSAIGKDIDELDAGIAGALGLER